MIHQVPIKSLPQDWLWCDTWCSNDTLKTAKTIDLCNNPQTKEAKLTAAQRIVPEWKGYDEEIKQLMTKIEDEEEHLATSRKHSNGKKYSRSDKIIILSFLSKMNLYLSLIFSDNPGERDEL